MPGRTPAEAIDAFLDPLRDALRVLNGLAKLLISPTGGFRKGVRYSWVLNGADGMDLGAVGRFINSSRSSRRRTGSTARGPEAARRPSLGWAQLRPPQLFVQHDRRLLHARRRTRSTVAGGRYRALTVDYSY
jgi:hypothetical protein